MCSSSQPADVTAGETRRRDDSDTVIDQEVNRLLGAV
jgi:hypothetical protein